MGYGRECFPASTATASGRKFRYVQVNICLYFQHEISNLRIRKDVVKNVVKILFTCLNEPLYTFGKSICTH